MDVKGKVLLQLFNKSKLRNGNKTYLEQIFSLFIVKFKKLGFSAPLRKNRTNQKSNFSRSTFLKRSFLGCSSTSKGY